MRCQKSNDSKDFSHENETAPERGGDQTTYCTDVPLNVDEGEVKILNDPTSKLGKLSNGIITHVCLPYQG